MSVKVEQIENNKVCLEIEVDQDRVNAAIDQAVRSLASRVRVPGFRPGKVPKHILEANVGKDAILEEALDTLLPQAYSEALREHDIEPVDRPEIEVVALEADTPLVFKATVETRPEIELGQYKGLAVNREKFNVTNEEIDKVLNELRERHATYTAKEDEPASVGDFAMIDFQGTVDGEPFEGGSAENMPIMVGGPGYFPGFSEGLAGLRKNETQDVSVLIPPDFHEVELAGKQAVFSVTMKEVHKKELSELTDELAKTVGDFETLDELRADIEKHIHQNKEDQIQTRMREQAMKQLLDQIDVHIPKVMSERRAHTMLQNFSHDLERQGLTLEKYCELRPTTPEDIEQEFLPAAEASVKQELILDAIAKEENIVIGPEMLQQTLSSLTADLEDPEETLKEWFADGTLQTIETDLRRREALNLLIDEAVVTEVDPPEEDMEEAADGEQSETTDD